MAKNGPVYEEIPLGRVFTKTRTTTNLQRGKSFNEVRKVEPVDVNQVKTGKSFNAYDLKKGKGFNDVREYVESKKPGVANKKQETSTKEKRSTCAIVATKVVIFSIMILSLLAVIGLASYSYLQIEDLKSVIVELENKLNQTAGTVENRSSIERAHLDRDTAMAQLDSLQSTVNSLNTVQHTVTTQVNSLQSTVDTLTTRVNSPVNLYQNCIQETRSCTIDTTSGKYWKTCYTDYIPINVTGYHTADIRCEYEAHFTHVIQESHILRKRGSEIQCQCHISKLTETSPSHIVINSFSSTCSILVTRCPQTL